MLWCEMLRYGQHPKEIFASFELHALYVSMCSSCNKTRIFSKALP